MNFIKFKIRAQKGMKKIINKSNDQGNQQKTTDNVIGINELSKQKKVTTFSKHLHETHRIFVQSISPRLNDFFEGLNDFFFDMAEQAENNVLQNQYFAAIGDTRKNKSVC